ncbi:hypothetical protein GCM10027162_00190 [Streptomyces incanus]
MPGAAVAVLVSPCTAIVTDTDGGVPPGGADGQGAGIREPGTAAPPDRAFSPRSCPASWWSGSRHYAFRSESVAFSVEEAAQEAAGRTLDSRQDVGTVPGLRIPPP